MDEINAFGSPGHVGAMYVSIRANVYFDLLMRSIPVPVVMDERDRACLQALFVTDPRDDMAKIQDTNDKLLEGTCSWILSDPTYNEWLCNNQSQILWIHGDPGKGKTMLAISQSYNADRYGQPFICHQRDSVL